HADFTITAPPPVTASLLTAIAAGGPALDQIQLGSLPAPLPANTVLTLGFGTPNTQNLLVTAPVAASSGPVLVAVSNFTPGSAFAAGSAVLINDPLVAVIDHFGIDAFGANSPTIVFKPGQTRDIHLAGHG